jgi:GntR family transcriptional regulator/MocR family aminotransferase
MALLHDLARRLERGGSIQRALYEELREAMLSGRLAAGAPLPASRELADQLAVARGSVVAVYAQLRSEGYLEGRHGSGTFVAEHLPDRWFSPVTAPEPQRVLSRPPLSRWGRRVTHSPFESAERGRAHPFRPHMPAVDAFPLEVWSRLVARRARRDEALWLDDADVRGYAPLRERLAEHLRSARGVVCTAEQIVILPSVQQTLDLIARLTLDPGDAVWLEDPGYVGAQAVFAALGAKVVPVPVDADGIDVAAGVRRATNARLAYVTPGHQAPLGVTCTLERRLALLSWAEKSRALILEDDYDSEYRYEGRPVPALQSLDQHGLVIYTGTFSKMMLPSLRLAYAVLPESLLARFLAAKSIGDRYTPPLLQAALADFLEEGHFGRHLRRMRELYTHRRAALLSALDRELGGSITVIGASAGLDLTVRLSSGVDDRVVSAALAARSVEAQPLSLQALSARKLSGLVLGFAPFSPRRLENAVEVLASVLG